MCVLKFVGDSWVAYPGPKGIILKTSRHAAERFIERVRPGISVETARADLYEAIPVAYRQKRREPNIWYLLYDEPYTPAYVIVARQELWPDHKPPHAVRQGWRGITVLYGHEHY